MHTNNRVSYSLMKSLSPTKTDPTGALKPFERQKQAEENPRTKREGGMFKYSDALNNLAPSACSFMSNSLVISTNSSTQGSGKTLN